MSKFRVHKSVVQSVDAIVEALIDRIVQWNCRNVPAKDREQQVKLWTEKATKLVAEKVQVCLDEPVNLYGYQNDRRDEQAHIRIPKEVVNQHLGGGLSNDAGFRKTEEGFEAIVSDYDKSKWWNAQEGRFWQQAAAKEAEDLAWLQPNVIGVERVENEETGFIEIMCTVQD